MPVDTIIEITGAVIGLVYLFLEYKANFWLWPVGIVMSLFYVVIFVHGKFYADAVLNAYYVLANIYGLVIWRRHRMRHETQIVDKMPIIHTPKSNILPLTGIFVALWLMIYVILRHFTDSPVPVGDAFTTSLSVVAMWMLAKKHVEQWLLWVVVDVVSAILYVRKALYPTAILYLIYTVVAVFGYFRWRRQMQPV